MATDPIYLVRLVSWLGKALGESAPFFHEFSTDALGLELPAAVMQLPAVASALGQAEAAGNKVRDAAAEVEVAGETGDDLQILAKLVQFGPALVEFYHALSGLIGAIQANLTASTIPDAAARASAQAFAADLAKRATTLSMLVGLTDCSKIRIVAISLHCVAAVTQRLKVAQIVGAANESRGDAPHADDIG